MIKIAEVLPPDLAGTPLWRLMEQAGVRYAVGTFIAPTALKYDEQHPWNYVPLLRLKEQYARSGFELAVIEARPPLNLAKRGMPGRDEEIAQVVTLIENMGRLGIKTWCYEWMTDFNWMRTSTATPLTRRIAGHRLRLLAHAARTTDRTRTDLRGHSSGRPSNTSCASSCRWPSAPTCNSPCTPTTRRSRPSAASAES